MSANEAYLIFRGLEYESLRKMIDSAMLKCYGNHTSSIEFFRREEFDTVELHHQDGYLFIWHSPTPEEWEIEEDYKRMVYINQYKDAHLKSMQRILVEFQYLELLKCIIDELQEVLLFFDLNVSGNCKGLDIISPSNFLNFVNLDDYIEFRNKLYRLHVMRK